MAKKSEPKVVKVSMIQAANRVVAEMGDKATLTELAAKADALVRDSGGKGNIKAAAHHCKRSLLTMEALGVVKLTRPTELLVQRVKGK